MTVGPNDLAALSLAGGPTLSPDGSQVVAAVQTVDKEDLVYRSALWRFSQEVDPKPLTAAGPWSDTAPTFAPDGGKVAFLSTRDGRRQAYVADAHTGAARSLGALDGTVTTVVWLDTHQLVGVVERTPKKKPGAPVVVDWLRYKRDGGPSFVEPIHSLWLFDTGAPASRITDVPGRITCLTTQGTKIVYAMEERHSDQQTPETEVHKFDPKTGEDETIWRCPSTISALTATDRSARLVAVTSATPGHSVTPPSLWLLDEAGSATQAFPNADLECERAILGDSRPLGKPTLVAKVAGTDDVVFLATVGEEVALFTGNPTEGTRTRITPEGCSVTDFSAAQNGRLAACLESPTRPTEPHLVQLTPGKPERLSNHNDAWLKQEEPVEPQQVKVTATDGTELTGLLYKAKNPTGALTIRVHGGPHLAWGNVFDVENQALTSAGQDVLLPNLRGSAGKGTKFRAMTVGNWGGADHTDLMTFADWATTTGGASQLFLTGGSYGGFLTNWTLTKTTRFQAAISERSISNFISKLGTSDNGYTVNKYELAGADVFEEGATELLKSSPLTHAKSIKTPMLLIHGEEDYRCPIEQSEQLFVALRRQGTEAKFARFPGESHTLATAGRPDNRITRLTMILEWLTEHNKTK